MVSLSLFSLHFVLILLKIVSAREHREIIRPRIIPSSEVRSKSVEYNNETEDRNSFLYVLISNWTLKMKRNDHLILSPEIAIETIDSTSKQELSKHCEFHYGSVVDDKTAVSTLTICEHEFYGSLFVKKRTFFIQPLTKEWHLFYEIGNLGKWMYKRSKRESLRHGVPLFYNLTGDILEIDTDEDIIDVDDISNNAAKGEDTSEFMSGDHQHMEYFYNTAERQIIDKYSLPRWLELAVAADYTVINFHGTRVQQYVLALLNIVSAIYQDPSLDSNLKLVIVRIILYTDKKDGMVHPGNARRSLENVNKWNRQLLSTANTIHDVALWLTKLDIGGPSGYAPVTGACDPARSCALNRDEGLSSAFIIAHEIAHILGLTHDGDDKLGNNCHEEASHGSVMAPMVAATFHNFQWSSCSKKEFNQRIKQWSCLLNQPNGKETLHFKGAIQEAFTMNDQCRVEFGEGYELCKSFDIPNPCSHLWCGQTNVTKICKTKKGPPLEGTICSKGKWCINGSCEPIDCSRIATSRVIPHNKDGFWSEWSLWGRCSTSCGIGVQFRTRKCIKLMYENSMSSIYTKTSCKGDNENFRICDQPKCLEQRDIRSQECSRLRKLMNFEENSWQYNATWLPYEPEKIRSKCQLTCRNKKTDDIFSTNINLVDGSPCSYGATDICIQGKCHEMGCDNIFGSKKKSDTCGVCNGDDSSCENISNKFQRKLRRGMNRLTVIPKGAHNIKVDVTIMYAPPMFKDNLTITIRDKQRHRNDVRDFDHQGRARVLIVEGAAFYPRKLGSLYTIWARGPAFAEIIISLIVPHMIVKQGILISTFSRYVVNRNERQSQNKYVWLIGGWSPCSAACGGGNRHKTMACKDEETGKLVSRRKCAMALKPGLINERCNTFSCEFKWLVGPWGNCSASCGSNRIQRRHLYCVRSHYNDNILTTNNISDILKVMEPSEKCALRKRPLIERYCNRTPCQDEWEYTSWSSVRK